MNCTPVRKRFLRRVARSIGIEMRSFERMIEMLKARRSFAGGQSAGEMTI